MHLNKNLVNSETNKGPNNKSEIYFGRHGFLISWIGYT
jgi:hypothetical protein